MKTSLSSLHRQCGANTFIEELEPFLNLPLGRSA
jgi:hypothetical protein